MSSTRPPSVWGSLPFDAGDALNRARGVLRVNSAWLEPGHDPGCVATELAAELASLAAWQGLSAVEVRPRGDLAPILAAVVG